MLFAVGVKAEGGATSVSGKDWAADVVYPSILRCIWQLWSSRDCSCSACLLARCCLGRLLRFASEKDNYGECSEPKKLFCSRGDNSPRNSNTNNAGIKVGGPIPHPLGF